MKRLHCWSVWLRVFEIYLWDFFVCSGNYYHLEGKHFFVQSSEYKITLILTLSVLTIFVRDLKSSKIRFFTVVFSESHTQHLLFHAQCFPSYQPAPSPPTPHRLTVM